MKEFDFNLLRFFCPQKNLTDSFYLCVFLDNDIFRDKTDFSYGSSYHVLGARLMGLTYPDYLLWCVKNYGAQLGGKSGYCYPMFKKIEDCQKFCTFMNNKFKEFLKLSGLLEN